ncbi:MAG: SO2930 family diheme c-type cytochrome [Pseudomonadota bacterium]
MRQLMTLLGAAIVLLSGCGREAQMLEPKFHPTDNPTALSDWGLLSVGKRLTLAEGVEPYDLNTPLFTDYAHKLRTIWVPTGAAPAQYKENDVLQFPVGTVISKTFYYPRPAGDTGAFSGRVLKISAEDGRIGEALDDLSKVRLVETRLLVHRVDGWEAVSYVWNDEQTEAVLTRVGDAKRLTLVSQNPGGEMLEEQFAYIVPNVNQCKGCHAPNNTSRAISPIGPKPRHLNKNFVHDGVPVNQLSHLTTVGYAVEPTPEFLRVKNADWRDESASLDARARAYLDANCSHCHNPVGPADTSGLSLEPSTPLGAAVGLCKLPIAAGGGTGGRKVDIAPGDPDGSIVVFRMSTTDPDKMMPELGRSLAHEEGVHLITDWIDAMEGACS